MRPQLAMAAVFVLVIGSSLLLLRAKPGTPSIGPVRVTERGEPSPERDEGQQAAADDPRRGLAAAPTAGAEAPAPAGAAVGDVAARAETKDDGEQGASKGKAGEAQTALADAKATEGSLGCDAAIPKYDDVAMRFGGTPQAADAMWAAASCHKKRGDVTRARELYGVLAQRDDYKQKAEEAMNDVAPVANNQVAAASAAPTATAPASQAAGGAGKAGVAAPAPAPMPKAAKASAPTNIDQAAPGYSGSRSNASPTKSPMREADRASGF